MTTYELSAKYGNEIKKAVQELTGFGADSLSVQCDLEGGVYASEEFPDTVCTLVTSSTNGRCYVVTAKRDDDTLSDFVASSI